MVLPMEFLSMALTTDLQSQGQIGGRHYCLVEHVAVDDDSEKIVASVQIYELDEKDIN